MAGGTVASAPHAPTAAQLAQLATYQASVTSAQSTFNSAQTTYNAAQIALKNAIDVLNNYRHYIFGGVSARSSISNVLDEGRADAA